MHRRQEMVNQTWIAEGLAPFGLGIGLSTGDVAAALLGTEERLEYTLVGDTVNLAQRLQDLARPSGTTVCSEATIAALCGPDRRRADGSDHRSRAARAQLTPYRINRHGHGHRPGGASGRGLVNLALTDRTSRSTVDGLSRPFAVTLSAAALLVGIWAIHQRHTAPVVVAVAAAGLWAAGAVILALRPTERTTQPGRGRHTPSPLPGPPWLGCRISRSAGPSRGTPGRDA